MGEVKARELPLLGDYGDGVHHYLRAEDVRGSLCGRSVGEGGADILFEGEATCPDCRAALAEPEQPVVAEPLRARTRIAEERVAATIAEDYCRADALGDALAIIDRAALAVEAVRPETDIDESLDAAWKAVEDELPSGWTFAIEKSGDAWYAYAEPQQPMDEWDERGVNAMEETPKAALRALAAALLVDSNPELVADFRGAR